MINNNVKEASKTLFVTTKNESIKHKLIRSFWPSVNDHQVTACNGHLVIKVSSWQESTWCDGGEWTPFLCASAFYRLLFPLSLRRAAVQTAACEVSPGFQRATKTLLRAAERESRSTLRLPSTSSWTCGLAEGGEQTHGSSWCLSAGVWTQMQVSPNILDAELLFN